MPGAAHPGLSYPSPGLVPISYANPGPRTAAPRLQNLPLTRWSESGQVTCEALGIDPRILHHGSERMLSIIYLGKTPLSQATKVSILWNRSVVYLGRTPQSRAAMLGPALASSRLKGLGFRL